MADNFDIPILLLVFNRPDTTQIVFNEIRKQKPKQLFVAADGPRDIFGEREKCLAARRMIEQIDWDCELRTLFREKNLGCGKAVSEAIGWFFENVEEGIILEDDCLPDPTFFAYCQEMLGRYRENPIIGVVNGSNYLFGNIRIMDSYYFSRYPHVWGWATWRRVWQRYDISMREWPEVRRGNRLGRVFERKTAQYYWRNIFDDVYAGKIDTWDYQLAFQCFINDWHCVTPAVNLISNVGFGGTGATHTKRKVGRFAAMKKGSLDFPLRHPEAIERLNEADAYIQNNNFPWWKMFIKKTLSPVTIRMIRRYDAEADGGS